MSTALPPKNLSQVQQNPLSRKPFFPGETVWLAQQNTKKDCFPNLLSLPYLQPQEYNLHYILEASV